MFEWLVDKTYYLKKSNTLKNELTIQRKAHAQNTIAWTQQIEEKTASEDYKDMRIKLLVKENKKLKERIKELECLEKKARHKKTI